MQMMNNVFAFTVEIFNYRSHVQKYVHVYEKLDPSFQQQYNEDALQFIRDNNSLIVFTKRISFESLLPTQPIAIFLAFRGEVTCFSMFLAIASLHLLLSNPRTG